MVKPIVGKQQKLGMIGMDKINMKLNKTYYSWYKLKKDAGGQPEGILILTYALYKRYNTILSKNAQQLDI